MSYLSAFGIDASTRECTQHLSSQQIVQGRQFWASLEFRQSEVCQGVCCVGVHKFSENQHFTRKMALQAT